MQSNSNMSGANTKYAIIREHPDGKIEFKTSLSTYLGQWSPDLIFAHLDSDPSQLKAALTKEKKKLDKIRQNPGSSPYRHQPICIGEAMIPYQYYLIPVQLSYNIDLAKPL